MSNRGDRIGVRVFNVLSRAIVLSMILATLACTYESPGPLSTDQTSDQSVVLTLPPTIDGTVLTEGSTREVRLRVEAGCLVIEGQPSVLVMFPFETSLTSESVVLPGGQEIKLGELVTLGGGSSTLSNGFVSEDGRVASCAEQVGATEIFVSGGLAR